MEFVDALFSFVKWIGAPLLFAALVYVYKKIVSIKRGMLEVLRSMLITDYNKYISLGHAPIYAKENFENVWIQYHNLGGNGIFEKMHQEFLDLPTK